MQWKAIYFNNGQGRRNQTEWYQLRLTMCPGKIDDFEPSEMDLIALKKTLKFRKVKKPQQSTKWLEHLTKL